MGGLPRRATFIEREKADRIPTLILDSGNIATDLILSGADQENAVRKGEVVARAMVEMGYAAAAIGEGDLYLGPDNLARVMGAAKGKFAFLSANVKTADGKPVFTPSRVFSVGGVRVGVLGLTSNSIEPNLLTARYPGIWVEDPLAVAAAAVPPLRAQCDLVVALTHLGFGVDMELAQRVPGIDVIVGGRSRTWLQPPQLVGQTILTAGYFEGRAVGRLLLSRVPPARGWAAGDRIDLMVRLLGSSTAPNPLPAVREQRERLTQELATARQATRFDGTMVDMDDTIPDHPGTRQMVRDYRAALAAAAAAAAAAPVSTVDPGIPHYTGAAICRDCHRARFDFWSGTGHARAFSTLRVKQAEADPDCLPCHVTAYLRPTGFSPQYPRPALRGVQCEQCHGMGSLHGAAPETYRLNRIPGTSICLSCHTKDRDSRFDFSKSKAKVCAEK